MELLLGLLGMLGSVFAFSSASSGGTPNVARSANEPTNNDVPPPNEATSTDEDGPAVAQPSTPPAGDITSPNTPPADEAPDNAPADMPGDDMPMDHHTPTADGTPIILVFGQSNAGLLYANNSLQDSLSEMGSDALVIGVAEGGTSVASPDGDWNIVDGDGSDEGGALYEELLQAVADAEAADPNAYVAGAIWVQGEADRNVDMDYYEPTKALLSQLQADLGGDFPVTIVGLSDYQTGGDAGREHVQDAQMKLADDLAFADFLDVDQLIADADLSASEVLREDGLHYQPEFYGRIAEAILAQPSMKTALGLEAEPDAGHDAGHGDHSGGGVTMGFPMAPGAGASQEEISAFIDAVNATDETHVHDHGSPLAGEHMAALDLAPRDEASHVAIGDGDWDDPDIWSNGEVPGDGAKVLIPQGVTVNYGTVSDASLFTVRIDGKLEFETDVDSAMTFDTMLVAPNGHIEIGTTDNPVDANVTIDLIVADNGAIDTDWDPMLLSRGIISHGRADIHGAEKDSHLKVDEDPMAGDTSVSFGAAPLGWQVGDTIVVAGTNYEGHKWSHDLGEVVPHPSEDEVRVITSIEGDTVFFDDPLAFDHGTPRADLKTSVANYTRNVSVESESGDASDGFARGHVMFMHSDEVDVRYAEFHELGRKATLSLARRAGGSCITIPMQSSTAMPLSTRSAQATWLKPAMKQVCGATTLRSLPKGSVGAHPKFMSTWTRLIPRGLATVSGSKGVLLTPQTTWPPA